MTNDELSARVAEERGELNPKRKKYELQIPKPYTTDMNAAMELGMEMHSAGGWFGLSYCDEGEGHEWTCSFKGRGHGHTWGTSKTSAMRAICRAYLAFKGVE